MKKYKIIFITLCFVHVSLNTFTQVLTEEERKLYNMIMQYRTEEGLPNIPLSASLTYVAQTHVKDLHSRTTLSSLCNMHSWSEGGAWSPCCYTSDHDKASCMWNKPRELTSYKGDGFEISFGSFGAPATAAGALDGWKGSSGHNAVIINQGMWESQWNAIGIGLFEGYAVVWFGHQSDDI